MPQELQDKKTPVKPQDALYAFGSAWINLFNEQPKKESLVLLLAHTSLETGVGFPYAHNYSFGNIKSYDGDNRDYTYYKCNELVKLDQARAMVTSASQDGGSAYISGVRADGMAWINFEPKSKYCRFRAFQTVEEGALDYISFLYNRYKKDPAVWAYIVNPNPYAYCDRLHANGYFTADVAIYAKSVTRLYNDFLNLEFDLDKLPVLTDAQKERINNLITTTFDQSISENISNMDKSTDNS